LRWWRHVYIVDIRGGLVFVDGTASLAVPAHDAFATDHGVCDVFGAVAFREACVFAHGAEARVVTQESVDAFWVEDVVAG
jgi:hypothetical protein